MTRETSIRLSPETTQDRDGVPDLRPLPDLVSGRTVDRASFPRITKIMVVVTPRTTVGACPTTKGRVDHHRTPGTDHDLRVDPSGHPDPSVSGDAKEDSCGTVVGP